MIYSDETIEEVRSRNDIVAVIGQYVELKKKGGRFFGLCPFHSEKTGSFSVSAQDQMYYCFGCHAGGNVFSFIMQYENETFGEAMQTLADRVGMALPKEQQSAQQKRENELKSRLLDLNKEIATYYFKQLRSPIGERGMAYFKRRGLSDDTMKRFGLGYAPQNSAPLYKLLKDKGFSDEEMTKTSNIRVNERGPFDPFFNRVMFPIMDVKNKVIGFGGRVLGDGEPKYYNSLESIIFDKGRNLYGLNYAHKSRRKYFLLCEGYMDVISLHQSGFDCAVASLGTALTSNQAKLIKRYVDEVIITYDCDGAGQKAALRAIPMLREVGIAVKVLDMKPHKDPDEFITHLGPDEYEKRISEAKNWFFFVADTLAAATDMADPEARTKFHRELAGRLAEFSDPIERENYLTAIAARFDIKPMDLRELVNFIGSKKISYDNDSDKPLEVVTYNPKSFKGSGLKAAQQIALGWAASCGLSYEDVTKYLLPEYFTEGTLREVADLLFADLKACKKILPASIAARLNEEKAGEVAEIFACIDSSEDESNKRNLIVEKLKAVKGAYIKTSLSCGQFVGDEIQKLIDAKREFEHDKYELVK